MTKQMQALLMLASHPVLERILLPAIDVGREEFHVGRINYGVLSGGEKAAVSWAWCIWKDQQIEATLLPGVAGVRDPFESFGVLSRELQQLIAKCLLHRWS